MMHGSGPELRGMPQLAGNHDVATLLVSAWRAAPHHAEAIRILKILSETSTTAWGSVEHASARFGAYETGDQLGSGVENEKALVTDSKLRSSDIKCSPSFASSRT
jgi:hypothetical protein